MAFIVGDSVRRIASIGGIDGKVVASTPIFSTDANHSALLEGVWVRVTAATAITVGATAQVEIVAASGDVFASDVLTNVLVAGDTWFFAAGAKGRTVPPSSTVSFNITSGATGTSQTLTVEPIGHLF